MTNDIIDTPPDAVLELPDCAPTKVMPQELEKAILGKDVNRYYASSLLSIKEDEAVPNELFQHDNFQMNSEFTNKIIGLLSENDICDKIGVKFIARVYDAACSNDGNQFSKNICYEIKQSKTAVAKLAILYNNSKKDK